MSDKTKIEWSDATWNPITGCTKVSEGCRHCYAATFAERWRGIPGHYFENGFDITLRPDKLNQPLRWTKPRKIFVNSMSDLFHNDIPDDFIRKVWEVMVACPHHTFQVLTKRPERMREWVNVHGIAISDGKPAANIWLGTSVENQKVAHRVIDLYFTRAAIRFISYEPALGELDITNKGLRNGYSFPTQTSYDGSGIEWTDPGDSFIGIDWVICGAESGHGAREFNEDWARSMRDQCVTSRVAFFYKQNAIKGKKIPLPELDGKVWNEFPEVRQ